jgi:nucleotidyltransferase substrate binding protein (TIGR01987 family)
VIQFRRWQIKRRSLSFSQSINRLSKILQAPKTVANRDSAIKRFELTFELSWKAAKSYLAKKGIICRSPRDCLEQLFLLKVIPDDPNWLQMIEGRNKSVHTYNEKLAEEIYGRLREYLKLFMLLRDNAASK